MKNIKIASVLSVLFFSTTLFAGNHITSIMGKTPSFNPQPINIDTTKNKSAADSSYDDDDKVRSYAIGLTFGSDQSTHGLHGSEKLPYMEPNFTYTAPKGFYIELSVQDILIKKDSGGGFDALDLNPGWDITLGDNTTLNFNWSHYTFKAKTPLVIKQDLSNVFETYLEQYVGETKGKLNIDYDYYKNNAAVKTPNDWIISPDVEHTFEIKLSKKSSLSLEPEGSVDFGTRNAYTHYQANAKDSVVTGEKVVRGKKVVTKKSLAGTTTNNGFGTLDYNVIFTVDLKIGNFEFEPAYNYTALLYKPAGVPTTPLSFATIDLIYTIDHKVKK